jgi:hypothetical protein
MAAGMMNAMFLLLPRLGYRRLSPDCILRSLKSESPAQEAGAVFCRLKLKHGSTCCHAAAGVSVSEQFRRVRTCQLG